MGFRHRARLAAHLLADAVVTQTHHVRGRLADAAPWLADKIVIIRNGVDLGEFQPGNIGEDADDGATGRRRVSSSWPATGPRRTLSGCSRLWNTCTARSPRRALNSTGNGSTQAAYGLDDLYRTLKDQVRQRGLRGVFHLHGAVRDVARLYREASLVCLPSFYEGCSNVICEAAASGVPLLVSDVVDNRRFVLDGVTGFLADPHAPETFADAILRFHRLPAAARQEMGRRARAHAEALFDPDRFADDFEALIRRVARPAA